MEKVAPPYDPVNKAGVVEKLTIPQKSTASVESTHMGPVESLIHHKKAVLRRSSKLKSQIHSHINDLIETLKERERQLFLEVEEYDLDCIVSMADNKLSMLYPMSAKAPNIDKNDTQGSSSTSLPKKSLKFIGNLELLKTQLQQFGKLEVVEETTNKSTVCPQQLVPDSPQQLVPDSPQQLIPDSPQDKKSRFSINELMKKFSKKNGAGRLRKESSGSIESFEVIDGLDYDEYRKYIQSLKDEDDSEAVSDSDEFQPWQPSFPIHEALSALRNMPEPEPYNPLFDPFYSGHECFKDSASGCSSQSPVIKETADPVTQINRQLLSLWSSPSGDRNSKPQSSPSAFPLEQRAKNVGLSPKVSPVPSAIIQKTFNKYLDQEEATKWLVSSDDDRLQCKVNCGQNSLVSNSKGLPFKMR